MWNTIVSYLTDKHFLFQLELILRIFIAFFCGAFIGRERKVRGKDAGTKTHSIVAIASCLLMIISQYGFVDFLQHFNASGVNINHDPSRIAAQIVTGIGFLGAGMVFVHKKSITGLTTAAGIWATAGIGMSVGAGMYFISITTTIMIIIVQILSHKKLRFFFSPITEFEIHLSVKDKDTALTYITDILDDYEIHVSSIESEYKSDNLFNINIHASIAHEFDKIELANKFYRNNTVISVKI